MRHEFSISVAYEANGDEAYDVMRDAVQQAAREILTTAMLLAGKNPKVNILFYSNGTGLEAVPLTGMRQQEEQTHVL